MDEMDEHAKASNSRQRAEAESETFLHGKRILNNDTPPTPQPSIKIRPAIIDDDGVLRMIGGAA